MPATGGHDGRGTHKGDPLGEQRHAYATTTHKSHRGNDLGPDGDHAEEQGERGQGGGFFDDSTEHGFLLERIANIDRCLFHCQVNALLTVD